MPWEHTKDWLDVSSGVVKKQAQSLNWDHWLRDPAQHKGHRNLFQRNRPGRCSNLTSGAIVYANRGNAGDLYMQLNHLNLCNFDVLCKWHISTSPRLLNLIELICECCAHTHGTLNPPQDACKDAQSCSPKCQEPSTMAVYLGLFCHFFHLLHVFKEVEKKGGICTRFARITRPNRT